MNRDLMLRLREAVSAPLLDDGAFRALDVLELAHERVPAYPWCEADHIDARHQFALDDVVTAAAMRLQTAHLAHAITQAAAERDAVVGEVFEETQEAARHHAGRAGAAEIGDVLDGALTDAMARF